MFPKLRTKPHTLGKNSTSCLVYWKLLSITPPEITFKSPRGCFTIDAGQALCWTECVWLTDIIQTLGSVSSGSQPSAGADIHIMELRQARSPMQERVKTMENIFCIDMEYETLDSYSCLSFDRADPPPFLVWHFWRKVIAVQMSATVLT